MIIIQPAPSGPDTAVSALHAFLGSLFTACLGMVLHHVGFMNEETEALTFSLA